MEAAGAESVPLPCSDSQRQSFGDLAGLDRPPGLPTLRTDSGKGRLAFSNPQPTAFPSHALNVSALACCALLVPPRIPQCSFSGCTQGVFLGYQEYFWDMTRAPLVTQGFSCSD